ncbi:MAG TPA: DUF488 domain-containing protein [Acidimicrobiales bacterium]|nr:DUF488 domain-containing protein [Acidimicrobiales bacterium]
MTLYTVGHGTLAPDELLAVLGGAHVDAVVDVRTVPGSRRHPHFSRDRLAEWMPAGGVGYRWEPELGGFRKPRPDSRHVALRHPSFRGYADYMDTDTFAAALERLLEEAAQGRVAAMCSESVWWRCHRRLLADAVVVGRGGEVLHLMHDGRVEPHRPTEGVRPDGERLAYDVGVTPPLGS